MEDNEDTARPVRRPKSQQNAKAPRLFRDAMDDIPDIMGFRSEVPLSVDYIRNAGRKVSVELRKLLSDRVPLVHRVLQAPIFHPLRDKRRLAGDVYENSFAMRVAPGTEDGPDLTPVAAHTWSITVHPLHGLRFDSQPKKWIVEPLFDAQAPLMTLGTWLNQALFQVDERVYSLGDTLKFFANKEAVHVDIDKDEQTRDVEGVRFGHQAQLQAPRPVDSSHAGRHGLRGRKPWLSKPDRDLQLRAVRDAGHRGALQQHQHLRYVSARPSTAHPSLGGLTAAAAHLQLCA